MILLPLESPPPIGRATTIIPPRLTALDILVGVTERFDAPPLRPNAVSCDFCGSAEVAWQFPCETWDIENPVAPGLTHRMLDSWMACTPCRDLVDADDWDGLLARVLVESPMASMLPADQVAAMLRPLWTGFAEHRRGAPIPV
jgi:hypothetical protein